MFFRAKIDRLVLTMHKTLVVTDWLSYVQNILQPSFVGLFHFVSPRHLLTIHCLRHNPALLVCVVGEQSWPKVAPFLCSYRQSSIVGLSVCLSVCDCLLITFVSCAKTAELI